MARLGTCAVFSFVTVVKLFSCVSAYTDTIFGFDEKKATVCDSLQLRLKCKSDDVIVLTEVRQYHDNAMCAGSGSKCCGGGLCFSRGNNSAIADMQHNCDGSKNTAGVCELPSTGVGKLAVHYVCWNHTEALNECKGRCGKSDKVLRCQCSSRCIKDQNCCPDYPHQCNATCSGRCSESFAPNRPCHCDLNCTHFRNCCPDFKELCQDGCHGDCPSECAADDLVSGDHRVVSPEDGKEGTRLSSPSDDLRHRGRYAFIIGPSIAGVFIVVVVVVLLCLFFRRRRFRKQHVARRSPLSGEVKADRKQAGSRAVTYADIVFESDEVELTGDDALSVQYASVRKPQKTVPVPSEASCLQTYDHIPERTSAFTTTPDAHYDTLQDCGSTEAAAEREPRPTTESEYDKLNRLVPGHHVTVAKQPVQDEYDTLNRNQHPGGYADTQPARVPLVPCSDGYEYAQVIPER